MDFFKSSVDMDRFFITKKILLEIQASTIGCHTQPNPKYTSWALGFTDWSHRQVQPQLAKISVHVLLWLAMEISVVTPDSILLAEGKFWN